MSDSTCRIRCTSEIHVKNKWFAIVFRGCCNSWHVQWKSVEKDIVSARTELGTLCSALPGSSKNVENQTGPSTGFPARYELIQCSLTSDFQKRGHLTTPSPGYCFAAMIRVRGMRSRAEILTGTTFPRTPGKSGTSPSIA